MHTVYLKTSVKSKKPLTQLERIRKVNRLKLEKSAVFKSINDLIKSTGKDICKEFAVEELEYGVNGFIVKNYKGNSPKFNECTVMINTEAEREVLFIDKVSKASKKFFFSDIEQITQLKTKKVQESNIRLYNDKLHISKKEILNNLDSVYAIEIILTNKELKPICVIFEKVNTLINFLYALLYIADRETEDELLSNPYLRLVKSIWPRKFETEYLEIDPASFISTCKELKKKISLFQTPLIMSEDTYFQDLFNKLDRNRVNKVAYEDFIDFFNNTYSGNELLPLFTEFTKQNFDTNYMLIDDLILFYDKVFNKKIDQRQAISLILKYKISLPDHIRESITDKLISNKSLSDEEFYELKLDIMSLRSLLYDTNLNCIYERDKWEESQNIENEEITNTIWNSSFSTLHKQHNMINDFSLNLLEEAINENVRFIEFSCIDGDEGEPIIGNNKRKTIDNSSIVENQDNINTMNSNGNELIYVREVLELLAKKCFEGNRLPFIVSIKSCCSTKQEVVLTDLIKQILKNIYYHEEGSSQIPLIKDLYNYFIIKPSTPKQLTYFNIPNETIIRNSSTNLLKVNTSQFTHSVNKSASSENSIILPNEPLLTVPDDRKSSKVIQTEENSNSSCGVNFEEEDFSQRQSNNPNIVNINIKVNINLNESKEVKLIKSSSFSYDKERDKDKDNKEYEELKHTSTLPVNLASKYMNNKHLSEICEDTGSLNQSHSMKKKSGYSMFKKHDRDTRGFSYNHNCLETPRTTKTKEIKFILNNKLSNTNLYKQLLGSFQEVSSLISYKIKSEQIKYLYDLITGVVNKYNKQPSQTSIVEVKNSQFDDNNKFLLFNVILINENTISSVYSNYEKRQELQKIAMKNMVEVYPNNTRLDCSNFNPLMSWICGCQIVKMNYKNYDDFLLINKIFFRQNKGFGIVKKVHSIYDTTKIKQSVKIEFISTINANSVIFKSLHLLRKSYGLLNGIYDYTLSCSILGSWEDEKFNMKMETKRIRSDLINAFFSPEQNLSNTCIFNIYLQELAFLLIHVKANNITICKSAVPLLYIQQGIRSIPLYTLEGSEIEGSALVVKVTFL